MNITTLKPLFHFLSTTKITSKNTLEVVYNEGVWHFITQNGVKIANAKWA